MYAKIPAPFNPLRVEGTSQQLFMDRHEMQTQDQQTL